MRERETEGEIEMNNLLKDRISLNSNMCCGHERWAFTTGPLILTLFSCPFVSDPQEVRSVSPPVGKGRVCTPLCFNNRVRDQEL